MSNPKSCSYAGICSGCPQIETPFQDQCSNYQSEISQLLKQSNIEYTKPIEIKSPLEFGSRDRIDFTFKRDDQGGCSFGLYGLKDPSSLVDIESCPQMSSNLQDWYLRFRKQLPPIIDKANIRLRVSPNGERGVWIDTSNANIKVLLDEENWLRSLVEIAHVEMGQRYKPVTLKDGKLKLSKKVVPKPWFQTYDSQLNPIQLFGAVASFTQPGFEVNKVLVEEVINLIKDMKLAKITELFSGLGNFTLPFASLGIAVDAFELDPVSKWSFKESSERCDFVNNTVDFVSIDLNSKSVDLENIELLFVDPPRSGMMGVLKVLSATTVKPQFILYVSCNNKSLVSDLEQLTQMGYGLNSLVGVNQFPQSNHCEWVSLLQLI